MFRLVPVLILVISCSGNESGLKSVSGGEFILGVDVEETLSKASLSFSLCRYNAKDRKVLESSCENPLTDLNGEPFVITFDGDKIKNIKDISEKLRKDTGLLETTAVYPFSVLAGQVVSVLAISKLFKWGKTPTVAGGLGAEYVWRWKLLNKMPPVVEVLALPFVMIVSMVLAPYITSRIRRETPAFPLSPFHFGRVRREVSDQTDNILLLDKNLVLGETKNLPQMLELIADKLDAVVVKDAFN